MDGNDTAVNGHWGKGPGMKLFNKMKEVLGERVSLRLQNCTEKSSLANDFFGYENLDA